MPLIASVDGLPTFVEGLPESTGVQVRTLTHAWLSGDGQAQVGKVAIRLLAGDPGFTAGTIHAAPPRIELCRVLVARHGVDDDRWQQWCDEFADLAHHGFDRRAKYPSVAIDALSPAEVTRLVMGLRDLAHWLQ